MEFLFEFIQSYLRLTLVYLSTNLPMYLKSFSYKLLSQLSNHIYEEFNWILPGKCGDQT